MSMYVSVSLILSLDLSLNLSLVLCVQSTVYIFFVHFFSTSNNMCYLRSLTKNEDTKLRIS